MSEPKLIRNDSPHQVSMPEGAHVASGKKASAQEPTVRKVLAAPESTAHDESVDENRVLAPDADAPEPVDAQPVFDRHLKEDRVLAAAGADADHDDVNSVVKLVENEHMALMPETLAEPSHIALAPEALAVTRPEQGPLIKRSEQDRFVALPEPVPESMASHNLAVSAAVVDEPVAVRTEAVTSESPELSETMLTMLQMDFPARVVKLKIENDKVRTKLDALQDSTRS